MFITLESKVNQKEYAEMLGAMGALSRLSSESAVPYLGYRAVENIFCRAFGAANLSRSDCSADASKSGIGIGIKTFVEGNGASLQKVAEFNRDKHLFDGKEASEIVGIISRLRNERISATMRIHGLNSMIYHCVVRQESKIRVFECPMDLINTSNIKNIECNRNNSITFQDGQNEYSINLSKSTLYKRFNTKNILLEINVDILSDPYDVIKNITLCSGEDLEAIQVIQEKEYIILPLYSEQGERNVQLRSGLNQWNANGRRRDPNEVYIPIPSWIHRVFNNFFPERDKSFNLILPDGQLLNAKVCQAGRKALMTNPNKDLGKWILRQVLELDECEVLTYERLEEIGLDSIIIYKEETGTYSINFSSLGTYEEFKEEYKK